MRSTVGQGPITDPATHKSVGPTARSTTEDGPQKIKKEWGPTGRAPQPAGMRASTRIAPRPGLRVKTLQIIHGSRVVHGRDARATPLGLAPAAAALSRPGYFGAGHWHRGRNK